MKKFLFLLSLVPAVFCADLVICSFNRPMQLYALLESIDQRVSGVDEVLVICRSDDEYKTGYDIVQKDFPKARFFFQPNSARCRSSFKPLFVKSVYDRKLAASSHVVFLMDDMLVLESIDLRVGENLLNDNPNIYGFYYRLGKNIIKQNFTITRDLVVPKLTSVGEDIYTWQFYAGTSDWHYQNNLDGTMYRKSQIQAAITNMEYVDPNTLESNWQRYNKAKGTAACHGHSKTINIPMNIVDTSWQNKIIGNYTTKELNELFLAGKKMDIYSLDSSLVTSVHQDIAFEFIDR